MIVEGESGSLLSRKKTEVLVDLLALIDVGKNAACITGEFRALVLGARIRRQRREGDG